MKTSVTRVNETIVFVSTFDDGSVRAYTTEELVDTLNDLIVDGDLNGEDERCIYAAMHGLKAHGIGMGEGEILTVTE